MNATLQKWKSQAEFYRSGQPYACPTWCSPINWDRALSESIDPRDQKILALIELLEKKDACLKIIEIYSSDSSYNAKEALALTEELK